jgi:hypothetical protein
MRKLLRQIKRELKTAKHCAIYEEEFVRVWSDDGNQREPKSRDLLRTTTFACRFIVTVCAPFSIKRLASAAKSKLQHAFNHSVKHAPVGRAILYHAVVVHYLQSALCSDTSCK